ncbi:MAG: hypothetical protein LBJ67_07790 [Planctomycetaceae bacterium]|jgi:hypothetical protein|nr:hypothetical protein [Planctomycetaceae bacterium]
MSSINNNGGFMMDKILRFVSANKKLFCLAFLAGFACIASPELFAQSSEVDLQIPEIDYSSLSSSILSSLSAPLLAAVTLGLSVWGFMYLWRAFKRVGRG